jgi:non-ribosomal peptide synthase protein (TIGR01720 family)
VGEGKLEFVGRRDGQVKVRGHRIELGEVESVLLGAEGIGEAVVVMREEVPGDKRLVGYVVGKGSEAPKVDEVRSALKAKLPEYMVPAYIVVLERMPLTGNGKIDRRALPAAEPTRAGSYKEPGTTAEIKLAEIWQGVLGIERVGVYDNFFSLGGDSILSIQVVARARQAGLEVTAKQLFQNQTLGELASVAGERRRVEAEQGVVEGEVELTPIQEWFLEQEVEKREHWNQAMMLEVKQAVEAGVMEAVVGKVMQRHDALWLRFVEGEGGWKSWSEGEQGRERAGIPYARVDLGGMGVEGQKEAMERHAEGVQRSLDLERGPVMRVVEYELGEGRGNRLLLVVHHLAMDGVSWRILLEDLERGCRQGNEGKAIELGPKTTSYQYWAKRLKEYGGGAEAEKELDYWLKEGRTKTRKLPVDKAGGENTVASARHVVTVMSEQETQALLREVSEAYHTQINDVLLTGLGQAMEKWTGSREVLVNLEGHGREELFEEVDLTGTVGWFTSLFPVHLKLGRKRGAGEELKAIKEQLRGIPQRGIGYGVLRYGRVEEVREQLKKLPQPEISFNYLGQFDQVLGQDSWFGPAGEDSGASLTAGYHRPHMLDVTGSIAGGQLRLVLTYSENLYCRSTISRLAAGYTAALQSLIEHCRNADTGNLTPSDFPEAKLSDLELTDLLSEFSDAMKET